MLKISWPIVACGAAIGFFIGWGVLNGDLQGRVNLIYLLLVYLVIPLASVLLSLLSLLSGKSLNFAGLLSKTPWWSYSSKVELNHLHQMRLDGLWLLYQSQLAAIAFAIASLICYFLLLLTNDLNFVWRSSLISPDDLLPVLSMIAKPWWFWHAAQPSSELLQLTHDSRLQSHYSSVEVYYGWWRFILATQISYALLPRMLMVVICMLRMKYRLSQDIVTKLAQIKSRKEVINSTLKNKSKIVAKIPSHLPVCNWGNVPLDCAQQVLNQAAESIVWLNAGSGAELKPLEVTPHASEPQVLLVKGWEPPLGELADYLQTTQGYLIPLDFDNNRLRKLSAIHQNEWLRFVTRFEQWKLYFGAFAASDKVEGDADESQ